MRRCPKIAAHCISWLAKNINVVNAARHAKRSSSRSSPIPTSTRCRHRRQPRQGVAQARRQRDRRSVRLVRLGRDETVPVARWAGELPGQPGVPRILASTCGPILRFTRHRSADGCFSSPLRGTVGDTSRRRGRADGWRCEGRSCHDRRADETQEAARPTCSRPRPPDSAGRGDEQGDEQTAPEGRSSYCPADHL
jgi:hypothetical protein